MLTTAATASGALAGKLCMVTGATSGIGYEAALGLARLGARVVLTGRDRDRCERAASAIEAQVRAGQAESLVADLSSQTEVRHLAAEFLARHDQLHVLVNNAGALFEYRRVSRDGVEMTLAVNHLAPFLLTRLLMEALRRSGAARVINVSSSAHSDVPGFDFDDPQAERPAKWRGVYPASAGRSLLYALTTPWKHPAFMQYAHTKLANVLFTMELSRRAAPDGISANAVDPGLVRTGFARTQGPYTWFMNRQLRWFGKEPAEGARGVVALCSAPQRPEATGGYFVGAAPASPSPAARDPHAAARLWAMSEAMTGSDV